MQYDVKGQRLYVLLFITKGLFELDLLFWCVSQAPDVGLWKITFATTIFEYFYMHLFQKILEKCEIKAFPLRGLRVVPCCLENREAVRGNMNRNSFQDSLH